MGQTDMKRENPHSALVASLDAEGLALLSAALDERACREELGFGTFAEAAEPFRPEPACPRCGSSPWRDGREPSGLRRWRCRSCGARFTSLTGTVFEGSKAGLPTWARFIRLMRHNVPLDCAAELCGVSHQTAFEWRHRVLATVSGYQGRIVLRDRVWIDETYVNDTDLSKGYGQARKRGLSRQKLCILVAIDVHKNPIAAVCGHGKPSSARVRSALAGHLAPGSVVVHDRERAHSGAIADSGCASEAHRADCRDPAYLEAMEMVNSMCSWLKRYLWRFTGMSPANMQLYLDWYVYLFRVNQARDRWDPTARVLRHMMMAPARFRSSRQPTNHLSS